MYYDPQKFDPSLYELLAKEHPKIASSLANIEAVYANTGVLSERRRLEDMHKIEMTRLYARATVRSCQGPMSPLLEKPKVVPEPDEIELPWKKKP